MAQEITLLGPGKEFQQSILIPTHSKPIISHTGESTVVRAVVMSNTILRYTCSRSNVDHVGDYFLFTHCKCF